MEASKETWDGMLGGFMGSVNREAKLRLSTCVRAHVHAGVGEGVFLHPQMVGLCVRAFVRACLRECMRACVRACVCVCARARVRA